MKFESLTILASLFVASLFSMNNTASAQEQKQENQPLVYHDEASTGIGAGKHIVFLAGDHEYRSEETCPALARILAKRFGFKCTVLFNVDKEGFITPGNNNMPGLKALKTADLAVVFLRFQNFPEEQMQHVADYLDRAGPVVGMRTSTHAFKIPTESKFAKYDFKFKGEEYKAGFGRQVLGETWAGHYGKNHLMSTRHDIVAAAKEHPVLRGVTKPWAQCGGYWADPMPNSTVLTNSQPLTGMTADAEPAPDKKPCPGSWVRTYKNAAGTEGRVFTTTSGASEDILDKDFRRLMINGCLWAVGLGDKITPAADVSFVGPYHPVTFNNLAYRLEVKPADLAGWDSPLMSPDKKVQENIKFGKGRPKKKEAEKKGDEMNKKKEAEKKKE